MELLFGNEKFIDADVPTRGARPLTITQVMEWARDNALTERPELFMKGNTV
jgi:hypothetical protein